MPTMQEVRAKFPQYNDMSDDQLATALHRKFYSDMPFDQFAEKVGLSKPQTVNTEGKTDRERSWGETATDVIGGAAQGFQSGFQALLGLPGDAQQLAGSAASWGAGKLGFSPEVQESAKTLGLPQLPTTPDVNAAFESVLGPKFQPQTDAGRYARTIGEFAPAAMAGPGGLVRKAAMTVIPGVAVEGTGDLTGDNPYAKAAAGITAAVLTAGRGNAGTKEMLKKVGKTDDAYAKLEKQVNQAYNQLRSAGIKYDTYAVDAAVNDVSRLRINQNLAPKAFGLQQELTRFAGQGMDFQDLDELERIATGIMRTTPDATDKMFTAQILGKIRDIRQKGAVATNGSIPANEVNKLVGEAKELARRRIIARDINKMQDKAEWYVSGPESGLRNQFKSYGQKNARNLSKAEEAAFKSVVNREGILNPLTSAGSRMGQIVLGGAGYAMGDLTGAIVPLVGSSLARRFMEAYTRKGVDNAIKTVLAGRSAQQQAAIRDAVSKWEARTRAALSADAALRAGGENWFLQDATGRQYPMPVPTK